MTSSRTNGAVGGAAVAGLVVGAILTLVLTEPSSVGSSTAPTSPVSTTPSSPATTTPVLLVWTAGGLPSGLADEIGTLPLVLATTVVKGGQAALVRSANRDGRVVEATQPGWAIPIDTIAIDPPSFAAFVDPASRATIADLEPGGAILTAASAQLRGIELGGSIELDTGVVTVSGIVDDLSGAGAELIVHATDAGRLAVDVERYVLIRHQRGDREALSGAIAEAAGPAAIRFRSPAETTWLRHGDAVTPQVFIKLAYGEFAYRDQHGRSIEISPAWVERNIVTASVPILGEVQCHREAIAPLTSALNRLAEANLGHLVDPGDYAGCWSPRRIEGDEPISRHSWGIAVDFNIASNPRGSFSSQDPRLVDIMRTAGFTWGGTWLIPDPGHYELLGL